MAQAEVQSRVGVQSRSGTGAQQKTRIVMKFGGTSVADIARINAVADRV